MKVLVTDITLARHGDRGRGARRRRRARRCWPRPARRTSCVELVRDADAILTCFAHVTPRVVAAGERLRVIGRYGVGTDNIAVDEATRRGIPVTNVPVYCTDEVAEHVLGMLLALVRGLVLYDRAVRQATGRSAPACRRAASRADARGRRLRRDRADARAQGRGARHAGHRPRRRRGSRARAAAPSPSGWSSSPGAPTSSPSTSRSSRPRAIWSTREFLSAMKPTAYLLNAARGAIVDLDALAGALEDGAIAGAGIDVFEPERLPADHPLLAAGAAARHAAHRLLLRGVDARPRAAGGRERRRGARRPRTRIGGQPADPGGATMNATTTGCPVHAGFDPLGEAFLRDPYAVMHDVATRRCSTRRRSTTTWSRATPTSSACSSIPRRSARRTRSCR